MSAFCDYRFRRHQPVDGDGEIEASHCNMHADHELPHRCCCGWEEPAPAPHREEQ